MITPKKDTLYVEKTSYPAGYKSCSHHNESAQLIYPSRGVMRIETEAGLWIVPPLRGCWLPARQDHTVRTRARLEMHSVYIGGAKTLAHMPKNGTMLPISALLRALILWVEKTHPDVVGKTIHVRACATLFDQLILQSKIGQMPLQLPLLAGSPLAPIETALQEDVADKTSLSTWASRLSLSSRSLSRRFAASAGMGFAAYRAQVRLFRAIELLADGASVTSVAYDLGYPTPSAFIAAFKAVTGQTPGRYFAC